MYYSDKNYKNIPVTDTQFIEIYNGKFKDCLVVNSFDIETKSLDWTFNVNIAREIKIEEVRKCRSSCWQMFDGLYLGYERDKNDAMIADCELLRQSMKDAPAKAEELLAACTTLEKIEVICFKDCLNIPDSLKEICELI